MAWMVLAVGGAMAAGNFAALVRPPRSGRVSGDLPRAPIGRCIAFAAAGLLASVWALASLVTT